MSKLDDIKALGPAQIGRMATAVPTERPAVPAALRDEIAERVAKQNVTRKKGRPQKFASGAARQKAYRDRKKS